MASLTTAPEPAPLPLPSGVKSRRIDLSHIGHLSYHILEAGSSSDPLIVLLHGFPELAFSWRKVLLPLANAGYHVVAPDMRGFGRTTGWDSRPFDEVNLHTFSPTTLVRDVVVLVNALGYKTVKSVVGSDAGAVSAANCALIRPDIFQSVLLMTHPFPGAPDLPYGIARDSALDKTASEKESTSSPSVHEQLATLGRRAYKWYYSTASANADMTGPVTPGGLRGFFRGYFHTKSASWAGNNPHPLKEWSAEELVKMPYYYVMPLKATMPEAIQELMANEPPEAVNLGKKWLSDEELEVYVSEYARTTFQGPLNWYRVRTSEDGSLRREMDVFAGLKIKVPCAFLGGDKDWGTYQEPGAIEKLRDGKACEDFKFFRMIEGAGHWIPQEKPQEVVEGILELIRSVE